MPKPAFVLALLTAEEARDWGLVDKVWESREDDEA